VSAPQPILFAEPAAAKAITEARAVVFMVGSYDGSGNFGDIAQFQAALGLVERLAPALLPVPVLERPELENHRALVEAGGPAPATPVFFDPSGALDDGLLPLPAPAGLAFGAAYLYGGGYLNSSWGDRKLAMLRAGEALLAAGGAAASCRVASGLQAEAGWIAGLGEDDAALLRAFELLGTRDAGSGPALEQLGSSGSVLATADDAVAILGALPAATAPADQGPLRVNLHFAEHDWVSRRPEAVLGFYRSFLRELAHRADRPLAVQPLIVYFGGRIDERPAIERLRVACAEIGAEAAEPLALRPATLGENAPRLGTADLTLSCSYHVALTSLMLGVPAILLGDNPYYEQKAAGLAEDFGLPSAFMPSAGADPATSAAAVATAALGPQRSRMRDQLAARAAALRQRRAAAELQLVGRLGAGAIAALDRRAGELAGQLRERSAEPAGLHAQVASLRTELEEAQRRAESPLEAELRVQEAEVRAAEAHARLTELLGSRSWKLGEPLRRAGAKLRRR
jgi:hypothetical protein